MIDWAIKSLASIQYEANRINSNNKIKVIKISSKFLKSITTSNLEFANLRYDKKNWAWICRNSKPETVTYKTYLNQQKYLNYWPNKSLDL